jgi:alkane 1-monooxygenase
MGITNLRFYASHTLFLIYWISYYYGFDYLVLLYVFGILPSLDLLLGSESHQPEKITLSDVHKDNDNEFKNPIYRWVYLYLGTLISSLGLIYYNKLSLFKTIIMGINFGLVSSQGIAVAHELSHKKDFKDKILSKLILTSTLYNHFYIEHKYGHHINVATPKDPATSKKNQNVYNFIVQSVIGGIKSAWKIEYKSKGVINYLTKSWLVNCGIIAILYKLAYPLLIFFILQSFIGVFMLEVINYIEHYGLERKLIKDNVKGIEYYESVKNCHSWDSNNLITNIMLFRLGRHSDHHTHPFKEYQDLIKNTDSPKLPYGYMMSSLIALVPSLWFKLMNPKLEEYLRMKELK